MKYEIDCEKSVSESFIFWLTRFISYKTTTLSNRSVKDDIKVSKLIEELKFKNDIKSVKTIVKEIRNQGISGIHLYYIPLEKLFFYLERFGAKSLKEIDEEFLSRYLVWATANLSDATKKNYRIALLSFFSYIDKQNSENYSFLIELKNWGGLSGNSGKKLPSFMLKEEVKRFIEAIDRYEFSPKTAERNRLIIKIILYTGLRVSEALFINKKDFIKDGEVYAVQVRGKGNKPRVVFIKEKIIEKDLKGWLSKRKCDNNLLFCNQKGKPLTQAYISRTVEKILLSCGIRKEKNGAHMLRHTFATLLYQKSKDLILVQEALGHADINTSRIYTHFDKDRLKGATEVF